MSQATKRTIFRWIHIVFAIPIIGYIYSPFDQIPNYAPVARYVFVPILLLSGYWMYLGVIFAVIGIVLWLGASYLFGFWPAVLSQAALFIAWKTWLSLRRPRSKSAI